MSVPAQLFAVPVADDGGSAVWQEHGEVIEGTPAVPVLYDGTNRCRHCGDAGAYYIASNRGVYACRECLAGECWVAEVVESYDELAGRSIEPAAVASDDVVIQERAHCSLNGEKLTDLDAAERALSYLREGYNSGELERFEDLDGAPALRVGTRSNRFQHFHLFRDTPDLYIAEQKAVIDDGRARQQVTIRERADDSEVSER